MKTIHLLRHAKSSWDHTGLSDKERPLNERGIASCASVGPAIYARGYQFAHVFCSAGKRAQETIRYVSDAIPELNIQWQVVEELYTFSAHVLLEWCQELDEDLDEIMLVGHNPAITELCSELANRYVDHVPTCGYVKIENDVDSWQKLGRRCGTIVEFITPKSIP